MSDAREPSTTWLLVTANTPRKPSNFISTPDPDSSAGRPLVVVGLTASTDTTEALLALRDVAHGIFPPLLATDGLVTAVTSRARREHWQVHIRAENFDDSLLESEVRSTAYFAVVALARATSTPTASIELRAQDGFVHAKVVDPMGAGTADTRALVGAVAGSHVDELRLDPTMKVVGRQLLQYWLPRVDIVSATPANERCSRGLTVSRSSEPNAGEEYVQSVGPYSLFRGRVECPA